MSNTNDKRPNWDAYFIKIATDVSERSNCCRRHVGAVIVRDNHIISTGYNGTPIGYVNCFDGGCPRCSGNHKTGEKLDECLCVHAEQNAICQAARYGLSVDGGTIYVTCSPCLTCAKLIVNSGIKRVVYGEEYPGGFDSARKVLTETGIKFELHQENVKQKDEEHTHSPKDAKIEFVNYDGVYPNLCSGTLTCNINGVKHMFANYYSTNYNYLTNEFPADETPQLCAFWQSGGDAGINEEGDDFTRKAPWILRSDYTDKKIYPKYIIELLPRLIAMFNEHVEHGCCGGCI